MKKTEILEKKIPGITGVILAGGASSRMGSNKALLPYREGRFIESIHRRLAAMFDEVLVVTNSPGLYAFLPCRKVPDIQPGMGALAGIHAGLVHAAAPRIFVVACDMPYLSDDLIRYLCSRRGDEDAVIPRSRGGMEPLHALYGGKCREAMELALAAGERKIMNALAGLGLRIVPVPEVSPFDPHGLAFSNINTPQEYFRLREREAELPVQEHSGMVAVSG